jgi:hypothetical protein
MTTAQKLLEARRALAQAETLILEAYCLANPPLAQGLRILLTSLTSDRETLATLIQLAILDTGEERKNHLQRASDLLDSERQH